MSTCLLTDVKKHLVSTWMGDRQSSMPGIGIVIFLGNQTSGLL